MEFTKKFDAKLLDANNSLSCIESYLIYGLREQQYIYYPLFFKSYISFEEILKEFVKKQVTYVTFRKIKRLHSLAAQLNLISIKYDRKELFEIDRKYKYDYTAIEVKPTYMIEKYKQRMWRDDHYILIRQNEKNYFYLNNIPRDQGEITKEKLCAIFAGQIVQFSINRPITNAEQKLFKNFFWESLKENGIHGDLENMIDQVSSVEMLRDILGILRISRRRILEYLRLDAQEAPYKEYLSQLDKAYIKIEYFRVRNKQNSVPNRDILMWIYNKDRKFIQTILNLYS